MVYQINQDVILSRSSPQIELLSREAFKHAACNGGFTVSPMRGDLANWRAGQSPCFSVTVRANARSLANSAAAEVTVTDDLVSPRVCRIFRGKA